MTIYVIFGITLLVLFFIIYIVSRICKKLQEENNQIRTELVKQQEIVVELYKYADEVAMIKKDQKQINQKINEAKTDEEISNIISGILAANNSRMRNKAKSK